MTWTPEARAAAAATRARNRADGGKVSKASGIKKPTKPKSTEPKPPTQK